MLVEWPAVADSNVHCTVPVIIQDLFPTILEMASVGWVRTVQEVEGQSLVPLLQGNATLKRKRPLVWHFPNMWDAEGDGIGPYSAIRQGDWKLIYYYDTRRTMLFNLQEDIFEIVDHGTNPRVWKRREIMARRLTRELKRVDAQVPRVRATGRWCRWPDGSAYREPTPEEGRSGDGIHY